jgi:hypothetical protein
MRRVAEALPPLVSVAEAEPNEHSTPPEAEQERETAPAKPFVEVRLMTSVWIPAPVPVAGTLRMVDTGTIAKSLSGFAIITVAAELLNAELLVGMYWTVMRLVPWYRVALLKVTVAVELVLDVLVRLAEPTTYSEATR